MRMLSRKVRPINSLIFIADPEGGEPPIPKRGVRLQWTSSCISVGCYPEQDGPTEIELGESAEVDPGFEPAFAGDLDTPNRTVVVSTATYEKLFEAVVSDPRTRVRVWINDQQWPDKVVIGLN